MVARSTPAGALAAQPEPGPITAAEITLDRHRRLAQLGWLAAALAVLVGLGVWAAAGRSDGALAEPPAAPPTAAPGNVAAPDDIATPRGDELIGREPAGEGQPVAVQNPLSPAKSTAPAAGAVASSGPTAEASGAPSPTAPATKAIPGLIVSSRLTPAGLAQRIDITVSNPADSRHIWNSVGVTLTGVSLVVSDVDPQVTHTVAGGVHCFTPTPAVRSISPGAGLTFSFRVTNLGLGGLGNLTLDPPVCPG